MKKFEEPIVNVIHVAADIITTSDNNPIETEQSGNLLGGN